MRKLLLLGLTFGLTGCGDFVDEDGNTSFQQVAEGLQSLGSQFAEMAEALERDANVRAVPQDQLLEVVPERIAGRDRYDVEGDEATDRNGAGLSMASAQYVIGEDTVFVGVADLGALRSGVNLALRWIAPVISGEQIHGDMEEVTVEGYPAIRLGGESDDGHLVAVLVSDRFAIVAGSGTQTGDELIADALDQIDFDRLEDWRDYGR